ncbi:hypothetical protein AYO21_11340 [Fonsecaea monophora]|uniref:Metallo-beta-lactamase domain-containing protein n=1 Tax=Fonsecaea monophora TaxID=254056 RepID=A0A177ERD7_9EURO|nr:hypothetical protein AYO21_11340 [Fonsecaea monophora]OAG34518.1 hypothetical protein AYO21_11340 [Fonsecaea monophora]
MKLFDVPAGACADISIIDSTTRINKLPTEFLMRPPLEGMPFMPEVPTWSFLIESATGRKALFDLGVPPNWRDFAPPISDNLKNRSWDIQSEKHVADILKEHQIEPASINHVIWSHWHWDHLGDPSTFPPSTELIVGPGFKAAFWPGWPTKVDAPVRETDFAGREVREINFGEGQGLQIGKFKALDLFEDGSFYLLDTPGHAVGHLSGLVRTTQDPDTFIFLGGDLCHNGGEIRPSEYIPLPGEIHVEIPSHLGTVICPGAELEALNDKRGRGPKQPFFEPSMGLSIEEAIKTITKAQEFDADDNVLFLYAHSGAVRSHAELFPAKANNWKEKGWREKMFWDFLKDFQVALQGMKTAI